MSPDRLLTGQPLEEESGLERTLRPRSIREYVGQERIVDNPKVFERAARERGAMAALAEAARKAHGAVAGLGSE